MLLFGLGSAKTIVFVAIVFKRLWEIRKKVKHVEPLSPSLIDALCLHVELDLEEEKLRAVI